MDDQSSKSATLKPADLEVEETEKVANKTANSPASHKSAPAVLQPRNVQAGAGVKSAEMEPSNRSNGTQSKPSSNTPSKNLADSTKEEAKAAKENHFSEFFKLFTHLKSKSQKREFTILSFEKNRP